MGFKSPAVAYGITQAGGFNPGETIYKVTTDGRRQ